jgi:hypothetical protein
LKITVLEDATPCSPLKANQISGRIYRLYLQVRISRARYQSGSRWQTEIIVGNFGFYRKQDVNGRVDLSSHWLAEEQNETV